MSNDTELTSSNWEARIALSPFRYPNFTACWRTSTASLTDSTMPLTPNGPSPLASNDPADSMYFLYPEVSNGLLGMFYDTIIFELLLLPTTTAPPNAPGSLATIPMPASTSALCINIPSAKNQS